MVFAWASVLDQQSSTSRSLARSLPPPPPTHTHMLTQTKMLERSPTHNILPPKKRKQRTQWNCTRSRRLVSMRWRERPIASFAMAREMRSGRGTHWFGLGGVWWSVVWCGVVWRAGLLGGQMTRRAGG